MYLLQAAVTNATDVNTATNYFPIGLQLLFAIGFIALMMGMTHLLAQKEIPAINCKILKAVLKQ